MDYKYTLSVCVCIKDEANYILEFLDHYVKQGVDHFYIVSNNSNDNIEEVISNSQYNNLITLIIDNRDLKLLTDNSGSLGHKMLLDDNIYPLIIKETKWAIIVDADEFMFGKNGYTISTYLNDITNDIGCIYVIWNIINPSIDFDGNISTDFSIKKNLNRLNHDLMHAQSYIVKNANDFGKSIVRTSMLCEYKKLWIHKIPTKGITINNYDIISYNSYDNCNNINYSEDNYNKLNVSLNHYAIRNLQDYYKKEKQLNIVSHKNNFINGLFEMIKLTNENFIKDTTFLHL